MTPIQQNALVIIKQLNADTFGGWFNPSEVMAFCQIESAFRVNSYRYEPRLNEGSYGIMQVLASTAKSVGLKAFPAQMYDPKIGLQIGMTVANLYWNQETKRFGRDPSYEEWAASYNEGVGGVERDVAAQRDPDPAYTTLWIKAQEFWAALGVDS